MARELAFVLINPYTISKSRTGGVLARYLGRTDLNFVGARMYGPNRELVGRFADLLRDLSNERPEVNWLLSQYVRKGYAPHADTGRPRRVMMLLFEGENAIEQIWRVTGSTTARSDTGETIRDTYGDYIVGEQGEVVYFEPAVVVGRTPEECRAILRLWRDYDEPCGGIMQTATDLFSGDNVERTLVMLKPDNFRVPSLRTGNIVDILSSAGLRIVAVKKFAMTVAQAESFYGPVLEALSRRFRDIGARRAADALTREFGFAVPAELAADLCERLGPAFAAGQFDRIVEFMTGYKPSACSADDKAVMGCESCLALVYEGIDAVTKIRNILGATDPSKARPGSVRREFGSDVMVNAAHASDSVENARREMGIIRVEEDPAVRNWIERYYGDAPTPVAATVA